MKAPWVLPAVVLLATGCASLAPVATPPATPPTAGLSEDDRFSAAGPAPTAQDLRWWQRFGDPGLVEWVERALAADPAITIAGERLRQAQGLLDAARAARGPTLSAEAGAEWRLRREAGQRRLAPAAVLQLEQDLDVWGGLAQAERAARADVQRSQALRQFTRLASAATTARAYVEWRAALRDEALLAGALALQHESLRVVGVRVEAGLSPVLDRDRARAEVAATEAARAAARQRIAQAAAALQVLAGQPPRGLAATEGPELPQLQGASPLLTPLALMQQRPDLRAAEQALVAAAAGVGVAEADLRPRLHLPGSLVFGALAGGGAVELVRATLGAVAELSLFDGGARDAEAEIARSRWREAGAVYEQTLLQALQQVETALAAEQGTAARVDASERAARAAAAAEAQAQVLYRAGLVGSLDLFDAQRSALANRRDALQARADAALAAVAVFESLGLVDGAPA